MTPTEIVFLALLVLSLLVNVAQDNLVRRWQFVAETWKRNYEDAEDRLAQVYAASHSRGPCHQSPDHTLSIIRDITTRLEKNNEALQSNPTTHS